MSWTTAKIGDVCDVVSGATPRTSEKRFWGGDIFWTTPKDISTLESPYLDRTDRTITMEGLKSCAASILPVNSVLLSSRAPIGLVAINSVPMATNQGYKSLVANAQRIDSKFLYYWLKSKTSYLQGLGNGATFKEISKAVVERIEVPVPPLDEQRRIAAILDVADGLRRQRRRTVELLDSLSESIFLEMFGDPFAHNSALRRVEFEKVTSRITYGFTQPMSHHECGIPILTAKNVRSGYIDLNNVDFASRSEFDALTAKSKPQRNDILITKDGAILGRSACVLTDAEVCINQSVALVKPRTDFVEPLYLLGYLMSGPVQARIEAMKKGNAMPHLQITELARFPVALPSLELQRKFVLRKQKVESQKARLERFAEESYALFSSLQSLAFSGRL
ncbi:restriction endonuclease subunit S [Bradyrhizobium australafricanum]|uniref:restriction endonuclease subunit S n=1 Tax=Bradyrhizobium australafricanum TaxID=2821406 RepID=UPI001CE31977|nr:restriction endonuclease subunit S [Bradyrhizobium australafricanum]MCA6104994.1 restriction endonuclease subunit S [Bradyrhizobium australafricanum]